MCTETLDKLFEENFNQYLIGHSDELLKLANLISKGNCEEDIFKAEKLIEASLMLSKIKTPSNENGNNDEFIKKTINAHISILEKLKNKEIPESYEEIILNSRMFRDIIISQQGFALIEKQWVKPLAHWIGKRKCLEIMAGKGTLSKALMDEGVNTTPTDNFSWSKFTKNNLWCDIENIDALDSIDKYGKDIDIVIMSWCYMDELGYKCLLKMREVNPRAIMIYIGEGPGGCTGSDSLYKNMINLHERDFEDIKNKFQSFKGIHDKIHLIC